MDYRTGIFVDTSAFRALLDKKDDFYDKAEELWEKIKKRNCFLLTSNFILDESYTLLKVRGNLGTAKEMKGFLINSEILIKICRVTVRDEVDAWKWFCQDWSKLSFTDCVSFAVMKRLGLKEAFSFDRHFVKAGFKLVV